MQKPDFSVAEAFSAGVDLIERSFKSILIWALAMFVLTLIPTLAALVVQGGHLVLPNGGSDLIGVEHLESGVSFARRPQIAGAGLVYGLGAFVWFTVVAAVIYSAIYRTSWARKTLPLAGLRLGAGEGWLSLVIVVQVIGLLVLIFAGLMALFAVALVGGIVGGVAGRWIGAIGATALVGVSVWIMLRLSLCQAMTLAEQRFRFFESWGLTQGRSWKLFWTFTLVLALIIGLEALYLIALAWGVGVIWGLSIAATELKLLNLEPAPGMAVPIGLFWLAFVSFVGAMVRALLVAPLASAYRGLAGRA